MDARPVSHPTDQTLFAYGHGRLDGVLAGSVRAHLEACPDCRRRSAASASRVPAASLADGLSILDAAAPSDAPPPVDSLPPGLADHPDYEIVRELGRGGMGVVYLAHNKLMGRPEVLKVVGGHLTSKPAVLERFLREIRSAARLHHPNIVTAYSALRLGEGFMLSMEYVEGLDLSRMVKSRGPLPVANACSYVQQAAMGLQHAHERGMVHRDIKPANLILARASGKANKAIVKVLDFGLAKVTSEGNVDSGLTREGQMLGTPDYIAPEQIRDAQSADIRADIYSLGCTLYYLLAGRPPFGGDNLWDVYQAHFSIDAAPLNLARPEVPVELAALVAKMMAKDPARRFQEPREVAEALAPFYKKGEAASRTSRVEAPSPSPRTAVEPAAPPPIPGPDGRPPSSAGWQGLIDLEPPEVAKEPHPVLPPPSRPRPPWVLWASVAAASVVGILAAVLVVGRGRNEGARVEPERLAGASPSTPTSPAPAEAGPTPAPPPIAARTEVKRPAPRPLPPPAPVTLTFRPGVDGYEGLSTLEYDGTGKPRTTDSPFLWVDWPDLKSPEPIQHGDVTILRFDDFVGAGARRIPPGSTIVSAKLRVVTGAGAAAKGHGARVFRLKKPILFGDVLNTLLRDAQDRFEILATPPTAWVGRSDLRMTITEGPVEMDVTDDIRAWASGVGNYGWALLPWPNGMDAWAFLKPDCPKIADRPSLSVTFIPPAIASLADVPATGEGPGTGPRSHPESFVNSIGMKLRWIPAGEFSMGSPDEEKDAYPNEKPRHKVRLGAFYLGVTEVTRGQFRRFVDETGYRTQAERDGHGAHGWSAPAKKFQVIHELTWLKPGFEQTDEHPVVVVTWNDAAAFANWLGRKEGRTYRLPTEAEWEYACRAGTTSAFHFGDQPRGMGAWGNVADQVAKERYPEWNFAMAVRDGHVHTAPVGRFRPNAWGLFDMHGNAWEWCSDVFDSKYYERSPMDDPQGALQGPQRAERGGGWDNSRRHVRSATRRGRATGDRTNALGFRIALTPSATEVDRSPDGVDDPNSEKRKGLRLTTLESGIFSDFRGRLRSSTAFHSHQWAIRPSSRTGSRRPIP